VHYRDRLDLVAVLCVLVALGPAPAPAQSLDPASAEALAATLRMLTDPVQRDAALAGSPPAAAIDRQMQAALSTPELRQEFYAVAADIMRDLTQGAGGDASRMARALEAGRENPAGLASLLSPQTLERLRALTAKIAEQKR
jgi:hypothetical protein